MSPRPQDSWMGCPVSEFRLGTDASADGFLAHLRERLERIHGAYQAWLADPQKLDTNR